MLTLDNESLAGIITECALRSMDVHNVPKEDRDAHLAAAKRLRGHLVNMLTAQFEDGTQEVLDANTELKALNKAIKEDTEELENLAENLQRVNQLVGVLDQILTIAASFV